MLADPDYAFMHACRRDTDYEHRHPSVITQLDWVIQSIKVYRSAMLKNYWMVISS